MENIDNRSKSQLWKVLIHIPHDGHEMPLELMDSVVISEDRFMEYHEAMRDKNVFELVPNPYRSCTVEFPVSRLLCDPERFIGPDEVMERYGMGWYYEKAYDGTIIKSRCNQAETLTRRYYDVHHAQLDNAAIRSSRLLVIDLHSYHEKIIPRDFLEQGRSLPDICIGTDERYTPPVLTECIQGLADTFGFSTAINYPYSGTLVPNAVMDGRTKGKCISLMLEINRTAYLRENGTINDVAKNKIRKLISRIVDFQRQTGKNNAM